MHFLPLSEPIPIISQKNKDPKFILEKYIICMSCNPVFGFVTFILIIIFQITYLAWQAKEKEAELQNNWANNKVNRHATQNKYGFR